MATFSRRLLDPCRSSLSKAALQPEVQGSPHDIFRRVSSLLWPTLLCTEDKLYERQNDTERAEVKIPIQPLTITYQEALKLMPWQMDNPHIHTGYRRPTGSIRACISSIFGYIHNESGNILTHLTGAIGFMIILINHLSTSTLGRSSSIDMLEFVPMAVYLCSAISCLGMSTAFHTLNSHSKKISDRAHRCDYAGILLLAVGTILPVIYYAFHGDVYWQLIHSAVIILAGSITAYVVLCRRYRAKRILRTTTFFVLGCSVLIPLYHFTMTRGYAYAKTTIGIDKMIVSGFLYALGTGIYTSRFPERLYPGRFDIFCSSHQIFHTLVVMATLCQYLALKSIIDVKWVSAD
ncbi:uncharacterized protein IL334_000859 [Kwoniella shivajii]|uniref:Uncharacterized protein n=1 Tax=Kwoniella shivajii TaxID=564305 RepID=A0ABZ1CRE3_9TREE|nr:hypothetical protein IL334_000859 [Kwoniella shivajii]